MSRLESMVERMLREAIEAGEFDNLPGRGKPVDLSENPIQRRLLDADSVIEGITQAKDSGDG